MHGTTQELGTPRDDDVVIGVRFLNDDGYFGAKTYSYFVDARAFERTGVWALVRVNTELKSVYVISKRSVTSDDLLKRIVKLHIDRNNEELSKEHRHAIDALDLSENDLARGHKIRTQVEINHKEKTIMKLENIETRTFINGKDATEFDDSDLTRAIVDTQTEIDRLSVLNASVNSKKIAANIEALKANIATVVEILDSR